MKNFILVAVALFMASFAYAQSDKEEVDFLQAAFGMEKKQIVDAFVTPSEVQKVAFWKLYDEYETERKELGRERIGLLDRYANNYMTMTSEQADAWTSDVIDLQQKTDKLIFTYYGKIMKISDSIVATQFYQIESYILTYIRMVILSVVPFVKKQ